MKLPPDNNLKCPSPTKTFLITLRFKITQIFLHYFEVYRNYYFQNLSI